MRFKLNISEPILRNDSRASLHQARVDRIIFDVLEPMLSLRSKKTFTGEVRNRTCLWFLLSIFLCLALNIPASCCLSLTLSVSVSHSLCVSHLISLLPLSISVYLWRSFSIFSILISLHLTFSLGFSCYTSLFFPVYSCLSLSPCLALNLSPPLSHNLRFFLSLSMCTRVCLCLSFHKYYLSLPS